MSGGALRLRRGAWLGLALLLIAALGFVALGEWQLRRLAWKQDLIARLEQRLAATPTPPPAAGVALQAPQHEYLRVRLQGEFDHGREALVGASTVLGTGYWLMTPLREADGRWVWVNRGFLPRRDAPRERPAGPQQVEGLLRLSEPGGSLLQANQPQAARWYSRDVQALGAAAGLTGVAPFFVDVWPEPPGGVAGWPHPGLTVVRFSNNHRGYALTWFTLAALALGGAAVLWRQRGVAPAPD